MTYAGAHGRDEVDPVNWILDREWVLAREVHPLSARRAEATKIAFEDLDAPSNHLRWALGVAASALLVAGAFAASSFTDTSEDADSAGAVPEHVFASLEQRLSVTAPSTEAPAPEPAPAPVHEQPQQETAPASAKPQTDAVAAPDHTAGGGENQHTAPSAHTPAPAPAPAPAPPQNQHWGSDGQWGYGGQWGSGSQWGYGGQWGSGSQWGHNQWGYGAQQWSPVNGFGAPTPSSYSAAASTHTGPAMSMLDPFCNTSGR